MSCDVGKAREGLENELWCRWSAWKLGEWAELYIMEQSLFFKLSVTSPTSQLILQSFPCFTYITAHSSTLPLLHLRHSSFSNPSFASPTSQIFTCITWRAAHAATQPLWNLYIVLIFVTACSRHGSPWNMKALTFLRYLWGCFQLPDKGVVLQLDLKLWKIVWNNIKKIFVITI